MDAADAASIRLSCAVGLLDYSGTGMCNHSEKSLDIIIETSLAYLC